LASSTFASWADSGAILRDSLDTCVVHVVKNGYTFDYSIDLKAGLVFAAQNDGPSGAHSQRFLWGEYNGIHYLRRVCADADSFNDTGSIHRGGYDFYTITLNGLLIPSTVSIAAHPNPNQSSASFRIVDRNGNKTLLSGIQYPLRVTLFDIRGKQLFSGYSARGGVFDISAACSRGGCPNGPIIVRVKAQDRQASLSTIITK